MDRADIVVGFALAALAGGARGLRDRERRPMSRRCGRRPTRRSSASSSATSKTRPSASPPFVADAAALCGGRRRHHRLRRHATAAPGAGAPISSARSTPMGASRWPTAPTRRMRARRWPRAPISSAPRSRAIPAAAGADGARLRADRGDAAAHAAGHRRGAHPCARFRPPRRIRRGAWAVVVGSAITRPEHVTGLVPGRHRRRRRRLERARARHRRHQDPRGPGGAAVMFSRKAASRPTFATAPVGCSMPSADLAAPWRGRYRTVGAAVTGLVRDGRWRGAQPRHPRPAGMGSARRRRSAPASAGPSAA